MKTIFIFLIISLNFGITSLMAQPDYNYNQIGLISTNAPIKKIMWIKQSQFKQSVEFDHLLFFVKNSNSDDLIGDEVTLKIYHNNEVIHTKDYVTVSEAPVRINLYDKILLKKNDSLYLEFTLKPNPNNSTISYMINIQDRNTYLKNHTKEYREFLKTEASASNLNTIPSDKTPQYGSGFFGEHYSSRYTSDSQKKKKLPKHIKRANRGNSIANTLGFLLGM